MGNLSVIYWVIRYVICNVLNMFFTQYTSAIGQNGECVGGFVFFNSSFLQGSKITEIQMKIIER